MNKLDNTTKCNNLIKQGRKTKFSGGVKISNQNIWST